MQAAIRCQSMSEWSRRARSFEQCAAPSNWDLVTQSDTDALVAAVCDGDLPDRLRDWYQSGDKVRPQYRDNLVVLPHDPARWEDEDDAEDGPASKTLIAMAAPLALPNEVIFDTDPSVGSI